MKENNNQLRCNFCSLHCEWKFSEGVRGKWVHCIVCEECAGVGRWAQGLMCFAFVLYVEISVRFSLDWIPSVAQFLYHLFFAFPWRLKASFQCTLGYCSLGSSSSSSCTGFYNPLAGFSLLILEVSRSHTMTHTVGRTPWLCKIITPLIRVIILYARDIQ